MRSIRIEHCNFMRKFVSEYALLKITVDKSARMTRNRNNRKT